MQHWGSCCIWTVGGTWYPWWPSLPSRDLAAPDRHLDDRGRESNESLLSVITVIPGANMSSILKYKHALSPYTLGYILLYMTLCRTVLESVYYSTSEKRLYFPSACPLVRISTIYSPHPPNYTDIHPQCIGHTTANTPSKLPVCLAISSRFV